jgi:hypothetical protein
MPPRQTQQKPASESYTAACEAFAVHSAELDLYDDAVSTGMSTMIRTYLNRISTAIVITELMSRETMAHASIVSRPGPWKDTVMLVTSGLDA